LQSKKVAGYNHAHAACSTCFCLAGSINLTNAMQPESASSLFVGFGDLDNNTLKGLINLPSVEHEI
jgi:hypothetical protein